MKVHDFAWIREKDANQIDPDQNWSTAPLNDDNVQETEDDEEDDEQPLENGDHSRELRYDDDELNDPVNVSIFKI